MNARGQEIVRHWSRLGVFFAAAPSKSEVDLERLLLDTARELGENERLLGTVAGWLSIYGSFVARHRLTRLASDELEVEHQPKFGLLIESAVNLGALHELRGVVKECAQARPPRPLYNVHIELGLDNLAEHHASALSRKWGVLAPEAELRLKTIRPASWVLKHNPTYRDRIVRKGDLRVSIIETLRWDVPRPRGTAESGSGAVNESELSRLCGATRVAVRAALKQLELEGVVALNDARANRRENSVRLVAA